MASAKNCCNYCEIHGSQLLMDRCSICQSELTVCRGKFVNIDGNYSAAFPIRFPWGMMTDLQTLLKICEDHHTHHFLKDIKYMMNILEARYSPFAEWVLLYIEEYGYLINMFSSLMPKGAPGESGFNVLCKWMPNLALDGFRKEEAGCFLLTDPTTDVKNENNK